jgi:hypothetical protein
MSTTTHPDTVMKIALDLAGSDPRDTPDWSTVSHMQVTTEDAADIRSRYGVEVPAEMIVAD